MKYQCLASAIVLSANTIFCSAQVTALKPPAAPRADAESLLGAQLYRNFVGSGEGTVVMEPEGRVLVFQKLDVPVDGRQWRILAATPREVGNLGHGRSDGYVTVKADYREGANRGF